MYCMGCLRNFSGSIVCVCWDGYEIRICNFLSWRIYPSIRECWIYEIKCIWLPYFDLERRLICFHSVIFLGVTHLKKNAICILLLCIMQHATTFSRVRHTEQSMQYAGTICNLYQERTKSLEIETLIIFKVETWVLCIYLHGESRI